MLGDETSPYLAQHKDNPVHWRPWSADALAEAATADKPILLSIGYAACHWCHVMSHESFEDPAIAQLMNDNFICIKVDREERPDVDMIYQTALQALGQQGGWPLTGFLTPQGHIFAGGTYFPPEDNFGKPSFRKVLDDIIDGYATKRTEIGNTVEQIRAALARVWATDQPKGLNPNIIEPVSRRITQRVDLFFGGFEGIPKFPQSTPMQLIWRAFMRSAAPPFGQAVAITLDNMCQGGIYDHLGGGFARYSTDERWLVPHFEKMLYDNASTIELMTLVWQHSRTPLYAARVDETVDWVLREMVTKEGAFASSLDADSEGEEGKFYVWSEAEIDEVLGPNDAPFFKQVYGVTAQGNWEGKNILHRLGVINFLRPDQEAVLTRCRRMLLMARARRVRPNFDDKVLTDWNGMMIAALTLSGAAFKKQEWHFAGVRAFWAVAEKLGEGDMLYHAWRDQRGRTETTAEGYGQMARAAMLLYEVTSDQRYLEKAKVWVERLETHFADTERGGYFFTSTTINDVTDRVKSALDNATPNYQAVIAEVLARLAYVTGVEDYRKRAAGIINASAVEIERNPTGCSGILNALEFMISAVQIVIIGDERNAETQALTRAVVERSLPSRVLTLMKPGQKLPQSHPAFGKTQDGGKPTAYVCIGQTCSEPVTNAQALANGLVPQAFQRLAQAQAAQMQAANGNR
jgi:uncharacterized protein YyaL (SSP411 family)